MTNREKILVGMLRMFKNDETLWALVLQSFVQENGPLSEEAGLAVKAVLNEPDWDAIDKLTDEDIDKQIESNSDAVPDMGDIPLEEWTVVKPNERTKVHKG